MFVMHSWDAQHIETVKERNWPARHGRMDPKITQDCPEEGKY